MFDEVKMLAAEVRVDEKRAKESYCLLYDSPVFLGLRLNIGFQRLR
jgi:hypothetical protein